MNFVGRVAMISLMFLLVSSSTIMSEEASEAPMEVETYYLGLLKKGSTWTADATPEIEELQEAHLANMDRLFELGKLVVAGPLTDDGEIRGIYIFKAETFEEAKRLAESDPMIQSGRLTLDLHPWMVPKGILP